MASLFRRIRYSKAMDKFRRVWDDEPLIMACVFLAAVPTLYYLYDPYHSALDKHVGGVTSNLYKRVHVMNIEDYRAELNETEPVLKVRY